MTTSSIFLATLSSLCLLLILQCGLVSGKAKVVCQDTYVSSDCTGTHTEDCYLLHECSDELGGDTSMDPAYYSSCTATEATIDVFDQSTSDSCSGPATSTTQPIGICTDTGFGTSAMLICKDACDIHRSLTKGDIIKNVLMILFGLVTCFAGYRLFKLELFLVGFILAGGLTYVLAGPHIGSEAGTIGAAVGAGVVGGILAIVLFFLGVFCIGALFGALLVVVLLHAAHNSASSWVESHNYAFYTMAGVAGLTMGILAVKFVRTVIIVATSFSGAYSIMSAIDGFAENGRLSTSLLASISSQSPSVFEHLCWFSYVILSSLFVFFIAGMIVQFKITARNFDHMKVETVQDTYARIRMQRQGNSSKVAYQRVPVNSMDGASYGDDDEPLMVI